MKAYTTLATNVSYDDLASIHKYLKDKDTTISQLIRDALTQYTGIKVGTPTAGRATNEERVLHFMEQHKNTPMSAAQIGKAIGMTPIQAAYYVRCIPSVSVVLIKSVKHYVYD